MCKEISCEHVLQLSPASSSGACCQHSCWTANCHKSVAKNAPKVCQGQSMGQQVHSSSCCCFEVSQQQWLCSKKCAFCCSHPPSPGQHPVQSCFCGIQTVLSLSLACPQHFCASIQANNQAGEGQTSHARKQGRRGRDGNLDSSSEKLEYESLAKSSRP